MKFQKKTVHFITFIVVLTIGIQVYWNYVQYVNNRNVVIDEIQNLLDQTMKDYNEKQAQDAPKLDEDLLTAQIQAAATEALTGAVTDLVNKLYENKEVSPKKSNNAVISYSIIKDTINLAEFDKMLQQQLAKENFKLDYNLSLTRNGVVTDSLVTSKKHFAILTLTAKSGLSPVGSVSMLELNYANPFMPSLLKGLTGIIVSFLLCCTIIFALYYLLHIIKKQKKLSEVKNDFISNVTHEFKTPIATVASAIEAIKDFSDETITDKTKKYLEISQQQLHKLNLLVEKVMETSLLESSELNLDMQKAMSSN